MHGSQVTVEHVGWKYVPQGFTAAQLNLSYCVATLLLDGNTVGRHYAGPNWEHVDGSAVVGKAVANAAGKTPSDIPWLKLEVTAHRGSGLLSGVTTVQRINTQGGVHAGACDAAGALHSAPYAADYVFLKKGS